MGPDIAKRTRLSEALDPVHAVRVATFCAAALSACLLAQGINRRGALVLHNESPSEPEGLYVRTLQAPAVGRLAAFMAPAATAPYRDQHLRILRHVPVLKALAAGPGDFVCTTTRQLMIDGQVMAVVAARDPRGVQLPQWNGCRRLGAGEWFAYSNRVPNSFDSRYYGPIRNHQIIAVYRPLWIASRRGG